MSLTPRESEAISLSGLSNADAASNMGISERAYRRLKSSARRKVEAGSSGMQIVRTSEQFDADGETKSTSVVSVPERAVHEEPEGFEVKRRSVLIDAAGDVLQEWKIYAPESGQKSAFIDALHSTLDGYAAPFVSAPDIVNSDICTLYPIADHHLGMYAWAAETGSDYDLDIASMLLRETMSRLVRSSPNSKTAVVLNLGDFFHGDNSTNATPGHGHTLDVDTRWVKVMQAGLMLMVDAIMLALEKHDTVEVVNLPGNHDPHSAVYLKVALSAYFKDEPRVNVDLDPSEFWFWTFGMNQFGAHHGHRRKPADMAGAMAAMRPADWGATTFRYFFSGHIHHKVSSKEVPGVIWETFQTLAGKDAYHANSAYCAGRSMTSITYHRDYGEQSRQIVNLIPAASKASEA
jgi:hypothetical protein